MGSALSNGNKEISQVYKANANALVVKENFGTSKTPILLHYSSTKLGNCFSYSFSFISLTMKAFVAGIIAIATTTAAVGNSGQTMPEILVHMTKCGFACLPYAAKDAPCSTATDFDCICNGMGSLISGLTSCQHTISSCGSYADDSFGKQLSL